MASQPEIIFRPYYHKNQRIILEHPARNKIIAKGRRFGLTTGFATYTLEHLIASITPILWVDTTHDNIIRYVERMFIPVLQQFPSNMWDWRQQRKELVLFPGTDREAHCDFRSAERPENIEGFAYRLIILNEAGVILKNEYLWHNTIRPMILDFNPPILAGGTPKGKHHKGKVALFYDLFEKAKDRINWARFNFSSYDNPHLSPEAIKELEEDIPPSIRAQEIQGLFVDLEQGEIISPQWWQYYEELPESYIGKYQAWDTAYKEGQENDYSVCTTWIVEKKHNKLWAYLLNMWRGRVDYPKLKKKAYELYHRYQPGVVLIEDHASGQSLFQDLRSENKMKVNAVKMHKDKTARLNDSSIYIEGGQIKLPNHAPWLQDFFEELNGFPNTEHDDIVDSTTLFINYIFHKRRKSRKVRVST